jgi:hypothetical protein
MPGIKILSAMLIMVPATILVTAEASLGEPAAEACKASPGGAAPKGMHWYYRNNRATSKQCWYLGPVGVHIKSRTAVTTAPSEPPAARKLNAADADNAATAQTMSVDGSDAAAPPLDAAQASSPQPAPMQAASAQAVPAEAPPAADPRFGARWPENLPNADDTEQTERATVSSNRERRDAEANAQAPSNSAGGGRMAQASSGETALRYFSIAGMALIPLLLAFGWVAKLAREPNGSVVPGWLRTVASRVRPRRRREAFTPADFAAPALDDEAEFDQAAFDEPAYSEPDEPVRHAASVGAAPPVSPALSGRRARADWRERTPTDPAHDLKSSLMELMHDLRRAAESEEPDRYAQRSHDRAGTRVSSPTLQPAE